VSMCHLEALGQWLGVSSKWNFSTRCWFPALFLPAPRFFSTGCTVRGVRQRERESARAHHHLTTPQRSPSTMDSSPGKRPRSAQRSPVHGSTENTSSRRKERGRKTAKTASSTSERTPSTSRRKRAAKRRELRHAAANAHSTAQQPVAHLGDVESAENLENVENSHQVRAGKRVKSLGTTYDDAGALDERSLATGTHASGT
jgi:hypothetical protein